MSGRTKGQVNRYGNPCATAENTHCCAIHAAAPDMLEALRDIMSAHDSTQVGGYARNLSRTIEHARAIIRKATNGRA